MTTALGIIQQFCGRTNISVPTGVIGSVDPQVIQVLRLLEKEGSELAIRGSWQSLTEEATFVSVVTESQGVISTLASDGFRSIVDETFWDRSTRLPVLGPLDAKEWQTLKAVTNAGPRYWYRIRGNQLLLNPAPVAGLNFYFEYVSKNWIVGVDTVRKSRFTLDTDSILLPDDLVLQGLTWRWKAEKGFEYAEDFRSYEEMYKFEISRDGGRGTLSMTDDSYGAKPGIFVPTGNWNVP